MSSKFLRTVKTLSTTFTDVDTIDDVTSTLSRNDDIDCLSDETAFFELIKDDLAGVDNAENVAESIRSHLRSKLNLDSDNSTDDAGKLDIEARKAHVSRTRFNTVFGKELAKRKGAATIRDEHLNMAHDFVIEPFGGTLCDVCGFETKNAATRCTAKCGCSLNLCGSCGFKWKHKLSRS